MSEDKHFSADKIFFGLFLFTALEVVWGYAGGVWWDWGKFMLWGGLLFFAFLKGWLIAVYFMHLKFEGWIVKGLILPTPFLVLVIFGYVLPDVADGDGPLVHPVGTMYHTESGQVVESIEDHWVSPHGKETEEEVDSETN